MPADGDAECTLVRAARVHTLAGPPVEAFVTVGGRVAALGTEDELTQAFPVTRRVRLGGVVVPGLADAHAHPTMTAENLLHADCSPEVVRDAGALTGALRAQAAALPDGAWVVGSRYDHTKVAGAGRVRRELLDAAVPDRPVLLVHVASHWGVLNSAGLVAAGLCDLSPDPPGGALGRDADGRLDGTVYEQALFDVGFPALARGGAVLPASTMDARLGGLRRAQAMFHAAGITSMCDALCGPDDVALLQEACRRGELTMRTQMLLAYPHYPDAYREVAADLGPGGGDEWLRLVGVKAFVDGACAGGTCLVDEPYLGSDDHGMQTMDTADLDELVRRVAGDGVVLGVHANGDRAIRLLLAAHEKARAAGAPAARHRIEHCTLVDDDIVTRIRALGLVAVPFGSYARFHGDKLAGWYGEPRLERMFAHRALLDAGIPVAGSSDYPCGPYEPLAALASCVTRQTPDGIPVGPAQRVTVGEALRVYTQGSAYATGDEHDRGTLAPGMLADFVELADDPFLVPADELADVPVRSTWVGAGRVHGGD